MEAHGDLDFTAEGRIVKAQQRFANDAPVFATNNAVNHEAREFSLAGS